MENINELIPIQENNGSKAVNARDLHSFLESKQDFSNWIKGRINKYDFVEGKDFETLYFDYKGNLLNIRHNNFIESGNQQVSKIEYALSIGMAKELSMLENNERGKQARKYFIACEENKRELSRKELLLIALQAEEDKERLQLELQHKQLALEVKSQENEVLKNTVTTQAPMVEYVATTLLSPKTYTSTQMAKELGLRTANELHKKLKEWGIMFNQSGQWMLTAEYCGKEYTKPRTQSGIDDYGNAWSNTITVWTEKGRKFLHELFNSKLSA